MDLTWNIYETAAANLSITEMKSFVQKELKDIQTQSRAVALHIGKCQKILFSASRPFSDPSFSA